MMHMHHIAHQEDYTCYITCYYGFLSAPFLAHVAESLNGAHFLVTSVAAAEDELHRTRVAFACVLAILLTVLVPTFKVL